MFFHNLKGYDSHLLMQDLGKYKEKRLSCIAKNTEKYISFTLDHLRFLDSLNFMNESLGKLVNNLAAEGDDHFHHVKRHYADSHQRALLLRKGVYPYEWMDRMDKMDHTSLPEKEAFYSSLTLAGISDSDYSHAQNVWRLTMEQQLELDFQLDKQSPQSQSIEKRETLIEEIPGLQYIENYITPDEHDSLLTQVDKHLWLDDLKRRVQHYGFKYNYRARKVDISMHIGELPEWLERLSQKLYKDNYMPEVADQVIVNEYLPGQGISAHIDCEPCFKDTIISLSLDQAAL